MSFDYLDEEQYKCWKCDDFFCIECVTPTSGQVMCKRCDPPEAVA